MIFRRKNTYPLTNIYHCTVHKAGSQWIRSVFNDPLVKKVTGMDIFSYQLLLPGTFDPRKINDRFFYIPFPEKKIISPLYISYDCYKAIIKPKTYKTVYLYRDPRDLLISYYYSARVSHPLMGSIESVRQKLLSMSEEDGLLFLIDHLEEAGYWVSMRSWNKIDDLNVLTVKYEDVVSANAFQSFSRVFDHLSIQFTDRQINEIIDRYSFEKQSGRKRGNEAVSSHLRKGVSSDWKNHFTARVEEKFKQVSRDLTTLVGYE